MTVDIPFEQSSIESFIGLHSSSSTALVLSAKQHFAFNPLGEIPSWPSVRCNLLGSFHQVSNFCIFIVNRWHINMIHTLAVHYQMNQPCLLIIFHVCRRPCRPRPFGLQNIEYPASHCVIHLFQDKVPHVPSNVSLCLVLDFDLR